MDVSLGKSNSIIGFGKKTDEQKNEREKYIIQQFKLIHVISMGPLSVVWKVSSNKIFYALKIIQKRQFDEADRNTFFKNIAKLQNQVSNVITDLFFSLEFIKWNKDS